jgi:drug/metabolite transporter (DMT)-like permease
VSLALGGLYVGNSATYFAGLETVDASLAALVVYVYPALVAVLSLRFGRRLEGGRAWAALGLALVGVVLAVGGIRTDRLPPLDGLALVVVSPIIYAAWIILAARLSGERRDVPGDEGAGSGRGAGAAASLATALMMTATAAVYWVTALGVGRPVLPAEVPPGVWPNLLGVGILATFIAIQAFYAGAQRIGAAQASLVSTFEPVWTIALAAVILGESLEPVQLLGGALILAGVILAQTAPAPGVQPRVRLADE